MKGKLLSVVLSAAMFIGATVPALAAVPSLRAAETQGKTLTGVVEPTGSGKITYTVGESIFDIVGSPYKLMEDTTVVLTAAPIDATKYKFGKWATSQSIGTDVGNVKTVTYEVASDSQEIKAVFDAKLTVEVKDNVGGTVEITTTEAETNKLSGFFAKDATVTVKATPAANFEFVEWKNGTTRVGTNTQYDYRMTDQPVTLTAIFADKSAVDPDLPEEKTWPLVISKTGIANGGNLEVAINGGAYTALATDGKYIVKADDTIRVKVARNEGYDAMDNGNKIATPVVTGDVYSFKLATGLATTDKPTFAINFTKHAYGVSVVSSVKSVKVDNVDANLANGVKAAWDAKIAFTLDLAGKTLEAGYPKVIAGGEKVKVDSANDTYSFTMPKSDVAIQVAFKGQEPEKPVEYVSVTGTVASTAKGYFKQGTANVTKLDASVVKGGSYIFTMVPEVSTALDSISVKIGNAGAKEYKASDLVPVSGTRNYSFTVKNITESVVVTAKFVGRTYKHMVYITGEGNVKATDAKGTTLEIKGGKLTVVGDTKVTYTFTPANGYETKTIVVNGLDETKATSHEYYLMDVAIRVTFVRKGAGAPPVYKVDAAIDKVNDLINSLENTPKLSVDKHESTIAAIKEAANNLVNAATSVLAKDPEALVNLDTLIAKLPNVELKETIFQLTDRGITGKEEITGISTGNLGQTALDHPNEVVQLTVKVEPVADVIVKNVDAKKKKPVFALDINLSIGGKPNQQPTIGKPVLFQVNVSAEQEKAIKAIYFYNKDSKLEGSTTPVTKNGVMSFLMGHFSYAVASETPIPTSSGRNYFSSGGTGSYGYYITAKAGANGTISPEGETKYDPGTNATYKITPNAGYVVDKVLIDGKNEVTLTNGTYTFKSIMEPYTIDVTFKSASGTTVVPGTPSTTAPAPVAPNPATGDNWFAHLFA